MFNIEDIINQVKSSFGNGKQTGYLISTDLNHCMQYCKYDIDWQDGYNVLAVDKIGGYTLFKIDPPNRLCYSWNRIRKECSQDVLGVFEFIQRDCVAWCEV